MAVIFLALGTNIGNKKWYINEAIRLLSETITIVKKAPVYETKPVGFLKQDTFYNTVIQGKTNLSAQRVLQEVKVIEVRLGRIKRFPNGPREMDIDLLLYNNEIFTSENLILPHPRMHERDFVLLPLTDIAPELVHPMYNKTIRDLYLQIELQERSVITQVKEAYLP